MEVGPPDWRAPGRAAAALDALTVHQAGYSGDQDDTMTAMPDCPILAITETTVTHECDTLMGDSGSPIFIEMDGVYRIMAVESRYDDFAGTPEFPKYYATNAFLAAEELARLQ